MWFAPPPVGSLRRCAGTDERGTTSAHLLSVDGTHGGDENRHHREEEEGREDQEHQRKQHLDGCRARSFERGRAPCVPNGGGELTRRVAQRNAERLGPRQNR